MGEDASYHRGVAGGDSLIAAWAWWLWAAVLVGSFLGAILLTTGGSSSARFIAPKPADPGSPPRVVPASEVVAPQARTTSGSACNKRCRALMVGYYESLAEALYPIVIVYP